MRIIATPKKEKNILASVKKNATAKEIKKGIVTKGDYCVNHLCGCS